MRKGFTLIELMIVIAIIAIIAAIAIPNLLESRVTANESAASASLKSGVFAAQVLFQGGGNQDADVDGVGEYGSMQALAGLIATSKMAAGQLRMLTGQFANAGIYTAAIAANPVAAFATFGYATVSGYRVTCMTPCDTTDAGATALMWVECGPAPLALTQATGTSANNGEQGWFAAAVPDKFSDTGRRPFFICQDGQVRSPAQGATANLPWGAITAPANGQAPTLVGIASFAAYAYYNVAAVTSSTRAATAGDVLTNLPLTAMDTNTAYYTIYSK